KAGYRTSFPGTLETCSTNTDDLMPPLDSDSMTGEPTEAYRPCVRLMLLGLELAFESMLLVLAILGGYITVGVWPWGFMPASAAILAGLAVALLGLAAGHAMWESVAELQAELADRDRRNTMQRGQRSDDTCCPPTF